MNATDKGLQSSQKPVCQADIFHCYYDIYYFFPLRFSKISCFTTPPVLVAKNSEVKANQVKVNPVNQRKASGHSLLRPQLSSVSLC